MWVLKQNKMSINSNVICRLCLSTENLTFLFDGSDDNFNLVLALTTGLTINLNDGLPQHICYECSGLVKSALRLRNQSQATEHKLLQLGYRKEDSQLNEPQLNEHFYDSTLPDLSLDDEFNHTDEVKKENLENITSELQNNNVKLNTDTKHEVPVKKVSRKERRALYMNLVDGSFDPQGPVKCKVCKKTVNKWPSFVSHAKLHLGFKYVCEYCGKSFISSTQLNRHCRSHHGKERELSCKHCNYLALDNAQLLLHERRVHTGERPFVCDLCAAAYYSRRCLIQHLESHQTDTTVQCARCPQMLKSRRHLARHTYSAHTSKEFSYKCPVCCHVYRNYKYIRVHLKKLHGLTTKEAKIIKIKL